MPLEIRVSVDIGSHQHRVASGLSHGEVLEACDLAHPAEGFAPFFARLEAYRQQDEGPVAVAMEGCKGWARPLETLMRACDDRLDTMNTLKLARFKELFPGAAQTDAIAARKGLERLQLGDHLPLAKAGLQDVAATPAAHAILTRLTRRRRRVVREQGRVLTTLQADLQAGCPGVLAITKEAGTLGFLRFLTSRPDLSQLARLRRSSPLQIPGVGAMYARAMHAWQRHAVCSREDAWVGEMIQAEAAWLLELLAQITALEANIDAVARASSLASILEAIPGFGRVCSAALAGEIGTVERCRSDARLGLYVGMANLDDSAGKFHGSKAPKRGSRGQGAGVRSCMATFRGNRSQTEWKRGWMYFALLAVKGK